MRKGTLIALEVGAYGLLVFALAKVAMFRWTHIDMTQTRVLAEMWPWYGLMVLAAIAAMAMRMGWDR